MSTLTDDQKVHGLAQCLTVDGHSFVYDPQDDAWVHDAWAYGVYHPVHMTASGIQQLISTGSREVVQ